MKWDTNVKDFINFFQDGCPKHIRPVYCLECGFDGLLHRHGHYVRVVVTLSSVDIIKIYRFKCPSCEKTYALRPTFIGSNRQTAWDVEESIIEDNERGKPLAELATDFPPPAGPYSEKTFWRWKKNWNQRIAAVHAFISKQVLDKIPNMVIPVGKDKPQTMKEWLLYFWHKWKDAFPAQKNFGFFHWLYRMSRNNYVPFISIR